MIRVLVIQLLLFALPFALYAGYLVLVRGEPATGELWPMMPRVQLTVAGLILTIAGLLALATFSGGDPEGTYRPAIYKDGEIQPGGIE